jgi:hypothetical protein
VTRVDILSVLTRDMHMSPRAAKCVLSHGQVYLDEHQLGPGDHVVDLDETPGEFLHVLNRCKRIASPTPADIPIEAAFEADPALLTPHQVSCRCDRCEEWWAQR